MRGENYINRVVSHPLTLFIITLGILVGTAGLITQQIKFLISNFHMDFISSEVQLENNIAILVAAYGVFLERRIYLLRETFPEGIPQHIETFDAYSHRIGIVLILIAVVIVAIVMLFLAVNTWGLDFSSLKYMEIAILFALNSAVFAMLVVFSAKSLQALFHHHSN